jgi:hypothetical protein
VLSQRKMVWFWAHTLLGEVAIAVQVFNRSEAGKDLEISNQMCLVTVSAVGSDYRPVGSRPIPARNLATKD